MQKLTAQNGGGGKKWKSKSLYQTQPEVSGKVKWMATSERVNLFSTKFLMILSNEIAFNASDSIDKIARSFYLFSDIDVDLK